MFIRDLQPSIVDNNGYLTVVSEQTGELVLKVWNVEGQLAKMLVTSVGEGLQQLALNMSDLGSGNYILNAFHGDVFVKAIRFIKQ
jgi:hypothetical protein